MRLSPVTAAIVTFALLSLAVGQSRADADDDHLTPVDHSDASRNKYRELLAAKLGVTAFDCGRVVDSSSLGPEGVLSIWSQMQGGQRSYHVTGVEPVENLWQRSNSMRDSNKAQGVAIRRIDADIPDSTGKHVREILLTMLRRTRPAAPLGSEFRIEGYLQFSIEHPEGPPLEGEVWLPPRGPKIQALAKITDALWEYCKAAPENRPALASKIDREAAALLAELK